MISKSHLREAIRLGLGAARTNLVPGAFLWAVGLILVTLYYQAPAVAAFLDRVGEIKVAYSPWIGMASTAIFGSLVPWAAQAVFRKKEDRTPFRHVPWLMLFWALHGWQIDIFYKIQEWLFGSGKDAWTILQKTFVDEFVWVPFLAVPQLVYGYLFIEKDLSLRETKSALKRRSFFERAIPLMIANWVVWIPAVAVIYLFPLPLQLPLMNLVLGIWCLIITFFAKNA